MIETAAARGLVSVIDTGTSVLSTAADLVGDLTPRRRRPG